MMTMHNNNNYNNNNSRNNKNNNQIKSLICVMQDNYRHIINALVRPNILPPKKACKFK